MGLLHAIRGAACGLALLSAPAAAAELQATAGYLVSLGGTSIATVSIRLKDSGRHYAMALDARITGLAQFVASGTARIASAGRSTGSGLASEKFDLSTRAQGEDFTVAVEYASNNVSAFVVDPPLISPVDRVALERKHLRDVNDMLAAFVLKGGGLDAGLCDRQLRIFTGLERFNVSMRYLRSEEATSKRTGYQGPVVLCSISYSPISGHSPSSEVTSYLAEDGQILIWYAPLQTPGYFIPYRVLVTTGVGDLSMVLTDLTQ